MEPFQRILSAAGTVDTEEGVNIHMWEELREAFRTRVVVKHLVNSEE